MDERTNIWKYCSREQSMEFLLSLRLTEDFRGAQDHRLAQLYEISNHPQRHYRKAVIPKKTGGNRVLWIPDTELAIIQRRILRNVLEERPVSSYAAAYRRGQGLKDHAECHRNQKLLVKVDIHDFFGSISWMQVYQKAFPWYLFPPSVRNLLTNLCCFREALPQGAPTSPAISNLVMASFDESMGGWCEERQISYTRYCDDMTFSGEFDPGMVIRKVSAYLEQMGMVLNRKKTRVYTRGSRQEVTGLTVNERVQVPRFYKKKLRQEWYYCKKYGVKEHIKALSLEAEPAAYLAGLMGKVQYVLQIDPENREFLQYRKEIQEEITKNYEN